MASRPHQATSSARSRKRRRFSLRSAKGWKPRSRHWWHENRRSLRLNSDETKASPTSARRWSVNLQSAGQLSSPGWSLNSRHCALLGWLNGMAIVKTGVNSFIITLASASLYLGAMLILTKAVPYSELPAAVGAFGRLKIGTFLSPLLVIAILIGAALFVLYRFSTLGRQILAAGANARAAAMSGVPVDRVIVFSHALSGFLAACAALMLVARLGAAVPSVGGEEWLLPSFLGPVLGGTLLSGGSVAVIGTMIGAALVTTIRSGLLVLQIGNFWLQLFLGLILLFAVMADRYRGVYAERRSTRQR